MSLGGSALGCALEGLFLPSCPSHQGQGQEGLATQNTASPTPLQAPGPWNSLCEHHNPLLGLHGPLTSFLLPYGLCCRYAGPGSRGGQGPVVCRGVETCGCETPRVCAKGLACRWAALWWRGSTQGKWGSPYATTLWCKAIGEEGSRIEACNRTVMKV